MSAAADPAHSASSSAPRSDGAAARPPAQGEALFHERLLPSVGAWIVVAVLGATFGVVLVPLSLWLALIVGLIAIAVACTIAYLSSPVLEVTPATFAMGRASIDIELLGEPEELTGESWERTMHTGFEPLAYHCTRGWIHSGVRVEVLDEDDPVTAWVASSRRPEELALALRTGQRNASAPED